MTEKEDPYHLSGKPLPTTRIAPTNYTETAGSVVLTLHAIQRLDPRVLQSLPRYAEEVLTVLETSGRPMSTGEIAEMLELSAPPVRRALQAMRDVRLVQWRGNGPRDPRAVWYVEEPLR